jgi:PAB-dependent poly(A)-specific ribonuclease subunit 2
VNHSLFPFSRFNKTNRCGLENGQGPLDALNPLLQTLYNILPLKSSLKAHVCPQEGCLSCELGFLFHMMDEARFSRNKVCQPVRVSRLLKRLLPGNIATSVTEMYFSIYALLRNEFANRNEQHLFNAIFGQEDMTIPALVKTVELNGPAVSDSQMQLQLMSVVFSVSRAHAVAIIAVTDELDTQNQQRSSRANSLSNFSIEQTPEQPEWLLFNDFVVSESSLEEATALPVATAAKPVLAFYVNNSTQEGSLFASAIGSPVTADMFRQDVNLSASTNMQSLRFEPLSEEELEQVQRGDFTVALDTEFISIGLANMEIREDGSREIGKPGDMAVGRVSVLRASNGVPLIDHYVSMQESEIKDFVTRFSGIRPGDLDARTSPHWLVSSKSLYTKLRFLVDCGCKFVGHGLHTDFRIINLWVSASSLIDTVELFHISGQRFLSLKFLASKLLNKSIQGDEHCSIEDARTALELFRLHQKLVSEGTLESTIKSLYETGRANGWK